MPTYPRDTDAVHRIVLPAAIRCYWSEVWTINNAVVGINVEAQIVRDGAEVELAVYRLDPKTLKRVEMIDQRTGVLNDTRLDLDFDVRLTPEQLDAGDGSAILVFEGRIREYALVGESQQLHLSRPQYSI